MLDNLQLLFVYAPVMNVQRYLMAFLLGQCLRLPHMVWLGLGRYERQKTLPKATLSSWVVIWHFRSITWACILSQLYPLLQCLCFILGKLFADHQE